MSAETEMPTDDITFPRDIEQEDRLLKGLREADSLAQREFFELFGPRIERVCARALGNLPQKPGAIVSAESKAISTINSVLKGVGEGRWRSLEDEGGLLRLMISIASRKCIDEKRAFYARKNGGGRIVSNSGPAGEETGSDLIDAYARTMETPEFACDMTERCQEMLNLLSAKDQLIAQKRLEGYTEKEIADLMGMARRTVQNHIQTIRNIWTAAGYS